MSHFYKAFIFFPLLLATAASKAQTVPSSCDAADSIVAMYQPGADILALQEIYNRNLSDKDSLYIARPWSDTILHALIAVYNAIDLPARDSVVNMYYIVRPASPTLNQMHISADTGLAWVHNFKNGIIPVGYTAIDSIINLVPLNLTGYNSFSFFQYGTAYFQSPVDFNVPALDTFLMTLPDVQQAGQPVFNEVYYMSLYDTIYADHIGLTYEYRWGDCESGCINHHFWMFNVYHDCSVEYKGSYGDPINPTIVGTLPAQRSFSVSPNPVTNKMINLTLHAGWNNTRYTLQDMTGRILQQGDLAGQHINVAGLPAGSYILRIASGQGVEVAKVVLE